MTNTTPVTAKSKAEEATNVSGDASSVETKVNPLSSNDNPAARPDITRPEAGSADEVQGPVATRSRADAQLDPSEGVAAILSIFLTKGSHDTNANIAPDTTPAFDRESHDGQGVSINIGSEGYTAFPNQRTTIHLTGEETVQSPVSTLANIIIAGKTMAVLKDGDNVIIDSTTMTLGQVTTLAGIQVTVASEGIVVATSAASFPYTTPGSTAGFDDGAAVTVGGIVHSASQSPGQSLSKSGLAVPIDGEVLTHGSQATSTLRPTASITINGEAYPAFPLPDQPEAVLLAGHTLSQGGSAATINAQVLTYGPHGVSVVGSTEPGPAPPTQSVVTIDGTAFTATPAQRLSGVVVLHGQTLSVGGPDVNIAGQFVTAGSDGISLVDATVSASESAASHWSTSATEMAASYTLVVKQSSAEPAPDGESSGSAKVARGIELLTLTVAMVVLMLIKL